MNNNTDLPEGWAMPDYMVKRVNEQLNKKLITPEDELQNALDVIAWDITHIEPTLVDSVGWMSYLNEQL